MVGRLDPATGEVRLVTAPTERVRPYGIKIDADGVPWVACNGTNCLLKIDPATMELTEVKLPIPETTVRRLDIADDGMIWYACGPTRHRAVSGATTRRPARSPNGRRLAVQTRIPPCGTTPDSTICCRPEPDRCGATHLVCDSTQS